MIVQKRRTRKKALSMAFSSAAARSSCSSLASALRNFPTDSLMHLGVAPN